MPEKKIWNAQEHPIICDTHGTYLKPKKSMWVADNAILEGLVNQNLVVVVGERAEAGVTESASEVQETKPRSSRSKKITQETPEQEQEVEVQLPEESNTEVVEEVPAESILPEDEQ